MINVLKYRSEKHFNSLYFILFYIYINVIIFIILILFYKVNNAKEVNMARGSIRFKSPDEAERKSVLFLYSTFFLRTEKNNPTICYSFFRSVMAEVSSASLLRNLSENRIIDFVDHCFKFHNFEHLCFRTKRKRGKEKN